MGILNIRDRKWVCLKIGYPKIHWLIGIFFIKQQFFGVYSIFRHTQIGVSINGGTQ